MKLWKRQKQSMHKMVQWNKDLDLSEFYNEADRRGLVSFMLKQKKEALLITQVKK